MIKDRTDETLGARVFISCGQRTEAEKDIGPEAMAHFRNLGFEAYFAERVHSLEALTENIFRHLSKSEYAVFIDCQRDKLPSGQCRGSLFQCRPTTSDQYAIPSLGKGHYEFTYLVVSANFERVQKSFRLKFGGDRTKVEFSEKTETSHET